MPNIQTKCEKNENKTQIRKTKIWNKIIRENFVNQKKKNITSHRINFKNLKNFLNI